MATKPAHPLSEVKRLVNAYIQQGDDTLSESDFCSSNLQWADQQLVADVYGLIYDSKPWFVKFLIENNCLEEISFHPPENPLKTVGGKTIAGAKP